MKYCTTVYKPVSIKIKYCYYSDPHAASGTISMKIQDTLCHSERSEESKILRLRSG